MNCSCASLLVLANKKKRIVLIPSANTGHQSKNAPKLSPGINDNNGIPKKVMITRYLLPRFVFKNQGVNFFGVILFNNGVSDIP